MLKVISDSDSLVLAGLALQFAYGGDYNRCYTHAVVRGYDPILAALLTGKFYLPLGIRKASTLFGIDLVAGDPSRATYSEHFYSEVAQAYSYDGVYDQKTYGHTFSGMGLFLDTLSGVKREVPSFKRETHIRHNSIAGTVHPVCSDIPHSEVVYNVGGYEIPLRYNNGYTNYFATVGSINPFRITRYPLYFGDYFSRDFAEFLRKFPEDYSQNRIDHGFQTVKVTNLQFGFDCDAFVVTYHVSVETFPSLLNNMADHWAKWDVCIKLPFEMQAAYRSVPSVGALISTTRWQSGSYEYTSFSTNYDEHGWPELGPLDYLYKAVGDERMFPIMISDPTDSDVLDTGSPIITLNKGDLMYHFNAQIKAHWGDINPGALFSTAKAVKDMERSLDVNILQNLQKLPDIAGMMPAFSDGVKVLSRIVRRDLSVATLKEIADLLSQTELQSSFQWRPSLDVVREYLPQLLATVTMLGRVSSRSVGYGKQTFNLPHGSLGRAESKLVCKTKLVLNSSHRGLLSSLLGYDALGIVPKISNLWDLVPFSFAVNWFTGIGASIRRAEYAIALHTLPAYYVHTFTITSPLSASELDRAHFSSLTEDPCHLRAFWRDISVYAPPVRDSKFGLGIPTQLPPLGTVAALLWQLIFAAK